MTLVLNLKVNIICAPKIRNNYAAIQLLIHPILRVLSYFSFRYRL